jgi:signal recognition particle receptor subunit beta
VAQWSHADRTLFTKIVYYGPAFGGKTTNLEILHQITDPDSEHQLLSVQTADDRTLFFDLLPFDLGEILGFQVAMKIYAVPGQVRYETTRQVVLSGADAVVFVADSSRRREEQNRWSLQNLKMNMRANGLDPAKVPVLFQFNKQDLPDAAQPDLVAGWLGLKETAAGIAAVAIESRGVMDTFVAASKQMLSRLVDQADERTRRDLEPERLEEQMDRAFRPYLARTAKVSDRAAGSAAEPIVLEDRDLLNSSLQASVTLGERLCRESTRAVRFEREADALRGLSETLRKVGASFDRDEITDAGLDSAQQILGAPVVSLVRRGAGGEIKLDRIHGAKRDPLLGSQVGNKVVTRLVAAGRACVVNDLAEECGPRRKSALAELRAVACVPLETTPHWLLAYAGEPDGSFDSDDVRFLATLAGHLAVGLEKARLYEELEAAPAVESRAQAGDL